MAVDKKLQLMANAARFLSADAVEKANSGHPGLPMGAADIATVLFTKYLKFDVKQPDWPNRDRFVLSAGHGSMLLYSLLYLLGSEDFTLDSIKNFRQLGSRTAGHPEFGSGGGIETTTGPLGQGLANAVGMAIAERRMAAEFGDTIVDHNVFALVGDGCLMEGISHEAITLAGHLNLNKLIVIWDNNEISIDGPVSLTDSTDQIKRFAACGWQTITVDGHDHGAIDAALQQAVKAERPVFIAARTTIGYGAPNKAGTAAVHGAPLGMEELAAARQALSWPHPAFFVPSDILDAFRIAGLRSAQLRKDWEENLNQLDVEIRAEFLRRLRGELPAGLDEAFAQFKSKINENNDQAIATRAASQKVLEIVNAAVPEMLGGSADLTGSNNTRTTQMQPMTRENYGAQYLHWGVREHVMAAAMNGIALHGGLIPYSGTFLVFSDYCRPAIRLAAMMRQRVIFVFSHDSIGLGEDGPTHQPIEHLAALRAIPGLTVYRPADLTETMECWQLALSDINGPSAILLSRQKLPVIRDSHIPENLCKNGAYIALACEGNEVDVNLYASGSELSLAKDAQIKLTELGIPAQIISVPSFERFARASEKYKASITGNAQLHVAVEAGIKMGWESFIGSDGIFVGMHDYGASGPASDLFDHFKITPEAIVQQVVSAMDAKK